MKRAATILAIALTFAYAPAVAQVSSGSSPLTVPKGGTGANNESAARASLGLEIGTNVLAWDTDLDCIAAISTTGLITRTGSGACAARTITAPAAGITVTNGNGVSGNPALILANDLAALEGLASTGFAVRITADTWAQRTVAGTTNEVCVTNGDGISGDPTLGICSGWLSTAHTWAGVQTFASPVTTGTADVQQAISLSGDISPPQITSNTDDYAPTGFSTATTLRISTDASRNITGLAGGADGKIIIVHNVGSFSAVLTNQDAASTAGNRFLFGGDMTLAADTSVTLRYDATSSRWRAITSPGAGGGGGGVTSVTVAAGEGIVLSGTCTITTSGTCTVTSAPRAPRGTLWGLTLSNNVSSPNTAIDIQAGEGASTDATKPLLMISSAVTKTTGAWAVGSGNGGLDTGTVANSTWYHVFQIMRPDTGVVDFLLSTSATAPTMPASYTHKRRIGSIRTNGSAQIIAFKQFEDFFYWATSVADISASTVGNTDTLFALTVPTGVRVEPFFNAFIGGGTTFSSAKWRSPDLESTEVSTQGTGKSSIDIVTNVARIGGAHHRILTNTSGQISVVQGSTSGFSLWTYGWADTRGRL